MDLALGDDRFPPRWVREKEWLVGFGYRALEFSTLLRTDTFVVLETDDLE